MRNDKISDKGCFGSGRGQDGLICRGRMGVRWEIERVQVRGKIGECDERNERGGFWS